jgi:hypothetical protein
VENGRKRYERGVVGPQVEGCNSCHVSLFFLGTVAELFAATTPRPNLPGLICPETEGHPEREFEQTKKEHRNPEDCGALVETQ